MKKLVIGIIGLIILFLAVAYVFIPSKVNTKSEVVISTTERSAQRFLLENTGWAAWWPVDSSYNSIAAKNDFQYNGYLYSIAEKYLTGVIINTRQKEIPLRSVISLIPLGKDSLKVSWSQTIETAINPFQRIAQYRKAMRLKANMEGILQQFRAFINKEENIYGITVNAATVSDTLLVTTKERLLKEPEQADVYRLVDKLQHFITQHGAAVTNPPMCNVRKLEHPPFLAFDLMVALPVNKVLPNENNIVFKRMVPGTILVTEVKGGPAAIKNAFMQLDNYIQDHHYDPAAIPFESMITNRLQQPDTTQWITRICYPIL
jgi:hypothetical protein